MGWHQVQAGHRLHGRRPRTGAQDGGGQRGQVRGREEAHAGRLQQGAVTTHDRPSSFAGGGLPRRHATTRPPRQAGHAHHADRDRRRADRAQRQQHRGHLRSRDPGAQGRVAGRAAGRHRRAARRQWRGQEHDAEGDLQSAARRARRRHQGHDRVRRPPHRPADAECRRASGRVPGDGGPALLRAPVGGGEPARRRVHPRQFAARDRHGARARLHVLPAAQAASREPRRVHLRRRAADDGHRARADGAAVDDPARRAVDGTRAAGRRGDLRDRARPQRPRARVVPAGRAEHDDRAALRELRLHPRERPRGDGRRRRRARLQRGRQGVLSRAVVGRAAQLSRHQALSAPQAVARVIAESLHFDTLETRDPELRERAMLDALRRQVAHAKTHAPGFAAILADVDPAELTSRAALANIPVTRKSDLIERQKAARPFGGLAAVARGGAAHFFASPGPIYEPAGRGADYWRLARALFAAGFRAGDLVHNAYAYHLTPAGAMLESGALALGCSVFPGGTGQTEQQLAAMSDLAPDGYVGTPSFLRILLDKADADGVPLPSLRKAQVSGEPFPPSQRDALVARGIEAYQVYASADLGSIAYESAAREGLIVDEGVLLEILRPGTGDPVRDGEVGEVVVTTLGNSDYPLVRFATGDLSASLAGASP